MAKMPIWGDFQGGHMIETGIQAPEWELSDQFGRTVRLSQFRGKQHVLMLLYPLDFTPT